MERDWEEENFGKDVGRDAEDEDDVDWRMPSELGSPNTKNPLMSKLPSLSSSSSLAHGSEPCLQSKMGHSRTIVHIDLDCFYAQVEMLRNPTLRDKPLGIQQKNIVVTTNYVARARGVSKLSYIKDALIKCPDLVLVSGEDLTNYREMSTKVTEVLEQFCPLVERLGFDENFMDVTHLVESRLTSAYSKKLAHVGHSYEDGTQTATQCQCGCRERLTIGSHIALEMRDTLKSKLGLTSCAGIATNKLLAKLVGGHHKPNDQTVLFSEWTDSFMHTFTKPRQIPGIGHSSGKKLKGMGIQTLEELRTTPVSLLADQFGKQQAETMLRLAHGVDDTPVVSKGLPQSLSDEDSFKKVGTLPAAKETMTGLIKNLIKRLRSDGRIPHTMRVTVRKYVPGSWHRESRQTGISPNLFHKQGDDSLLDQLLEIAVGLLQKLIDTSRPFHLTLINICFTNLRAKVTKGALDSFFSKPAAKPKYMPTSPLLSSFVKNDISPVSRKDISCAKEQGDQQSANIEVFRNKSEFVSPSRNELRVERNVMSHTHEQSADSRGVASSRTSVNMEDGGEVAEPTSFFKKLNSSPNKSLSSLHRGQLEITSKHKTFDKELREDLCSPTDAARDTSVGGFDEKSSHDEEVDGLTWFSEHVNLKHASKRTLEESSPSDKTKNSLDSTAVKRMKNDFEHKDTKPTAEQNMAETDIPPDIDRSVFEALPGNMKEELIAEWKRAKRKKEDDHQLASSSQNLLRNKKPTSSAKKKQPPVVRNKITKYFKH